MAPPGTTSVEVEVYDVGKKVDGIQVVADIMPFQASQGQLHVQRTFAVNNVSKPPRTQMNEHNLEFYVPDGANVSEGQAMTAGGQPVNSAPVPEGANAKNRYAFLFPLAPRRNSLQRRLHRPLHRQREYRSQKHLSSGTFRRHRAQGDGILRRCPAPLSKSLRSPASPTPTSKFPPTRDLGKPLAFKLSGEGTLAAPRRRRRRPSQAPGRTRAKRKPPRRRPRTAHRRSRLLCRNIAGGFSADSPPSSSSAESSSPRASKPPTAPPAPKAKSSPEFEDDEEYEPEEVPAEREVRASEAGEQRASERSSSAADPPRVPPCCSKP